MQEFNLPVEGGGVFFFRVHVRARAGGAPKILAIMRVMLCLLCEPQRPIRSSGSIELDLQILVDLSTLPYIYALPYALPCPTLPYPALPFGPCPGLWLAGPRGRVLV